MTKKLYEDKLLQSALRKLPRYELSNMQREEILHTIKDKKKAIKKNKYSKYPFFIACCLALIICILAINLFTEKETSTTINEHKPASITEKIGISPSGALFDRNDRNGKLISPNVLFGIPDKLGLLNLSEWVAQDERRVAKIFILVWGNSDELVGKQIKVVATHTKTGEKVEVSNASLQSGFDSDDASALTKFSALPYAGIWNLHFSIEKEPFADFSVKVKEPYPQHEKIIINRSAEDFKESDKSPLSIEIFDRDLPKILSVRLESKSTGEIITETFSTDNNVESESIGPTTVFYNGKLDFSHKGEWMITIRGERFYVEVN